MKLILPEYYIVRSYTYNASLLSLDSLIHKRYVLKDCMLDSLNPNLYYMVVNWYIVKFKL